LAFTNYSAKKSKFTPIIISTEAQIILDFKIRATTGAGGAPTPPAPVVALFIKNPKKLMLQYLAWSEIQHLKVI